MSKQGVRWGLQGLVVVVAMCVGTAFAQEKDLMLGTWKLDVAKSTFSPGPAPKEGTLTIAAEGTARKVSVIGVNADGTKMSWGYTANFDREEYKMTGNNPDADVVMLRRVSATSTRTTYKLAGKETLVHGASVSADGKTLSIATSGVNGKGQTVKNSLIFERQ